MKKNLLCALCFCVLLNFSTFAQNDRGSEERIPDVVSLGLGLGFDYGGIGGNITVYPQQNVGLFFGGGYVIAGFGYNAGVRLRLIPKKASAVDPFFMAMYGYNAAVVVSDNKDLNKIFYGPSFGLGIDLHKKGPSLGTWSFAITIPIRTSEANDYVKNLRDSYGVSLNDFVPIGFSVGYKFKLD